MENQTEKSQSYDYIRERRSDSFRFKWLADGCKNFDQIVERLKGRIEYCQKLKEFGCVIASSHDGYVRFDIPSDKIEEYIQLFLE